MLLHADGHVDADIVAVAGMLEESTVRVPVDLAVKTNAIAMSI